MVKRMFRWLGNIGIVPHDLHAVDGAKSDGSRHHVIISGTGRAGTTLLVQLLTRLKLDTGFNDLNLNVFENCNAGLELDLRDTNPPYIVKSPFLCDYLSEVLNEKSVVIDHAFIPIRDIFAAAESRRHVERTSNPTQFGNGVPGGLWNTDAPELQESVLAMQLYRLVEVLADHEIPLTFLSFPYFAHDPAYLYRRLGFLVREIPYSRFLKVYKETVKTELIHNFG